MRHITLTELARLLGVRSDHIRYAHDQGFLAEPPKVLGRRAYDLVEVVKVADYFGIRGIPDQASSRLA